MEDGRQEERETGADAAGSAGDDETELVDGADGHDVGQPAAEPAPHPSPLVVVRDRPADPAVVVIPLDENGEGAGMVGVDADQVVKAVGIDGSVGVRFEPSHTIGITRITVTNGPRNGTVAVRVITK